MKIDFNNKHKEKILHMMERYRTITENYRVYNDIAKSLQDELNELSTKLQSTEKELQTIRDEEKLYMEELHKIYGDFSLNDLWDSIN